MKKIFNILIPILIFALIIYYRKRKKEKEAQADNPVYDLNPEQKTRKGSKYRALNQNEVRAMAKEVMIKLPSNIVLPDAKVDLINRLLRLQRESLIAVYTAHWNMYGKARKKDMIWYLDNHSFLLRNGRAKALRKALGILIDKRPSVDQQKKGYNIFWGLPMILFNRK
jgi:hypothetical protein